MLTIATYKEGFREKFIRLRGDMSQAEFGEKLGISRSEVSQYESGKRTPGVAFLQRIAEKCQISMDYLMDLTDDPDIKPRACDQLGVPPEVLSQIKMLSDLYGDIFFRFLLSPGLLFMLASCVRIENDVLRWSNSDASSGRSLSLEAKDSIEKAISMQSGIPLRITDAMSDARAELAEIASLSRGTASVITGFSKLPSEVKHSSYFNVYSKGDDTDGEHQED